MISGPQFPGPDPPACTPALADPVYVLSHLMAPSLNFLICTVGINTATPWEASGRAWCPQGPCRHRGLLPPPPPRVPASWASRALSTPPPRPGHPRKRWAAVRGGAQEAIKPAPAEAETTERAAGRDKSSEENVQTKGERGTKGRQADRRRKEAKCPSEEPKRESSPASEEAGERDEF